MSIRVIAGSAKGRQLKLVPGDSTRPIMDRVKEALFSIIGRDILDSVVLDLFAGTGSVGIEALSRGARKAVFIDREPKAIQTIQENLTLTRLTERAVVRRGDAFAVLSGKPDAAYDFIYIAPPQYKDMWEKALKAVDAKLEWLSEDGTVIVQIDPEEYAPIPLDNLVVDDERKYGNTLLIFYSRSAEQPTGDLPAQE